MESRCAPTITAVHEPVPDFHLIAEWLSMAEISPYFFMQSATGCCRILCIKYYRVFCRFRQTSFFIFVPLFTHLFYGHLTLHGHLSGFHRDRCSSLLYALDLAVLAYSCDLFVRRAVGQLLIASLRGALCL